MIERLEGFNSFRPSSGLWGRRNLDDVIEMFPVADPGPGDDVMMRWDQTKQLCGHAGPGRGRVPGVGGEKLASGWYAVTRMGSDTTVE